MSEQNNNCEQCGNNKEPTGECFDCVIRPSMVECGICYNLTQSPSRGFYCDHQVCGDCSNQITTCPFCRRPWDEEEQHTQQEHTCDECNTGHSTHWRRFVDTADGTARMVWWCNECWGDEEDNEGVVVLEERHNHD